ncbi:hypothetical protein [Rariglobus hedericola]|uniref:Uncharacterized protein n=1 Tax=Rariglobus hedericola TaxID=2597822 RepID=A0A556QPH6_9BACT|nr:hypothetical protein [Rariglobus hedericola]TSJ78502.1 hypothetical protein FPL22_04160 [Rariglobus hedericola]
MSVQNRVCLLNKPAHRWALYELSEKKHWAGVALGGTTLWVASASVALAERLFSLTLVRFI